MKVQCYAIFDSCSGIYEKPFFSTTDDLVKREFQDVATSADHPISNHPEHYSLWRLGIFNNENGKLQDEANECLWTGVEAVSQSQQVDGAKQLALAKKLNGIPGETPMSNEEIVELLADKIDPTLSPGGTA